MDYELSDSSGTDDDLPPSHQNRVPRGGRLAGNGRSGVVGSIQYPRMHNDMDNHMETQIHLLEQEAYCSVLRAFKAQSNALSWEKESLITELRKELRVSDEEHRVLLARVNADDIICRIREWRQAGGGHPGLLNPAQPIRDPAPSPTVSASRKKQKTAQSIPNMSLNTPSLSLHQQTVAAPMQPSSSAGKRGSVGNYRGKKTKPGGQTYQGVPNMQYPSVPTGRGQVASRGSSGAPQTNEIDPCINRRVSIRWPDDNHFYEAEIFQYDAAKGLHLLVYYKNTPEESHEWVDLKTIPPEDMRWEDENPGLSQPSGRTRIGQGGRGFKKSSSRGGAVPGAGRGRGTAKGQFMNDFPVSDNGIRRSSDDIEILHTDTLIKEVERVFGATRPDPIEVEKSKKMLKEHEQSLIDAIARLAEASDGESDEGEHQFSHGKSMDQDQDWRNQQYNRNQGGGFEDGMRGRRGEATEDHMGRIASYNQQDGDDI